jgi:predicted transcriptional regulator
MLKKDILKLESRRKIYNFILNNPGLHFREISRKLKIPISTLNYHLKHLNKKDFIQEIYENGYTRFYVKDLKKEDIKLINIIRQDIPRNIILLMIMWEGGFSQVELINYVNFCKKHKWKYGACLSKHHTTISYHFLKLESLGLIEPYKDNNQVKYKLSNQKKMIDLLDVYDNSLSNETDQLYRYLSDLGKESNKALERCIELFWDIFPNPYYV